ncbi:hypothetical protein [Limosilactobacillus antri]|uniref:Uncharacterized protein n=1 Tax=Limosilactobacillus antri DSM 16041 TaxID=525309 RepID=C8P8X2_9LACO|nr:hypothetical protein [Limosilactobacillus antri]EEW53043.1 hypothetical protein HMPREF0494_1766 [Limosilactobacillus antri DSM 16041]KRK60444.1 hypothetical protein FC31_GL001513 [Limosilactobacillus antri DSM 16041]
MAETDIPTTYKQIVRFGLDKDGFFGLICSSDNGKTIKLIVGPDGLVLHPEDGDKIWNLIESKVQSAIDASGNELTWSKISDKPDLVLEKDLPDFNQFAKRDELPDTSGLAKAATVDAVKTTVESAISTAEKAQSTADANSKALSEKVDRKDLPTDLVHSPELDKVRVDVTQAKQDAAQALAVAKSATTTLDASKEFVAKKPSEYQEGFSRELKAAGVLEVNQTTLGKNLTYSTIGLLTSVAIDSYGSHCVRQRFEVIDSDYPYTFERTGTGNVWYPWHGITEWD